MLCGGLDGKEIQKGVDTYIPPKGGDTYIYTADSFCCTVETNTMF